MARTRLALWAAASCAAAASTLPPPAPCAATYPSRAATWLAACSRACGLLDWGQEGEGKGQGTGRQVGLHLRTEANVDSMGMT